MSDVTFVHSRKQAIDGVQYTISVYRYPSHFRGFWNCSGCEGRIRPAIDAAEEAATIDECQRLIAQHHAQTHAKMVAGQPALVGSSN